VTSDLHDVEPASLAARARDWLQRHAAVWAATACPNLSRRAILPNLLMVAVGSVALPVDGAVAHDLEQAERIYGALASSVVRIETRYGASIFAPPAVGSGVVIGAGGLLATADHVIDGASEVWAVSARAGKQRAEVTKRLPLQDLALVRAAGLKSGSPLRTGAPARPGQCVFALGNVMHATIGIFQGIVSATYCVDCRGGAADRILTDITTPPGLSGGALIDCATGSLVGIVTFGIVALNSRAPPAGIVGAVPVSYLAQLLNQDVVCGNVRQPRC